MDPESGSSSQGRAQEGLQLAKKASTVVPVTPAYQSFGVVYGDLSVSLLYVFLATFGGRPRNNVEEYEGMAFLSFIFWTLAIILVVRYSFLVLCAHDNGEGGGTFALYALLCWHLKLSLVMKSASSLRTRIFQRTSLNSRVQHEAYGSGGCLTATKRSGMGYSSSCCWVLVWSSAMARSLLPYQELGRAVKCQSG